MKKRIFLTVFAAALITVLVSLILLVGVTYRYINEDTRDQLMAQLDYLSQAVDDEGLTYLNQLENNSYRITWIAADGAVLFDNRNNISRMENHADRQEFIDAKAHGVSDIERESETMTTRLMYVAEELSDGSVLRIATNDISVGGVAWMLAVPSVLLILCISLLAWFVARKLSRALVEPLNTLDLDHPLAGEAYDELVPLLSRIEQQHREIADQRVQLGQQRNEFQTVIDNMREGLVLLNQSGRILLINRSGRNLMKAMAEEDDLAAGEEIITSRNSVVDSLLDKAYDGKTSSATIIINSRSYEIHASPVESDEGIHGAVLFYVDVTEKVEAEQLRREFSANVSHELKTPLHSISGCAELMLSGIVKEEDKPRFLKQIYDEAQHMVSLIENIIKISRLDEEADALPVDKVDLYEIAQTVIEQLGNKAASRGIVMDLSGTHVTIKGVKTLLYEMIYNLCDNAIKYNVDDGAISVSVKKTKDAAVVKVKDTGVGISEDQQERIFERFYRIDKSHSRASGGTGLGLSIVKHAAIWHNATIKVKSKLGKGTTFIVRFPLKLKK
ncbi:MAG: ATP-binding protein [Peptococcaceae bacterium]|nr:ATP-binding protein [Peptococcaceae bacterium]